MRPRRRDPRHPLVRLLTVASGAVVVLLGVVLLVLPGPGWATILAGLAVLGRELPWAERLVAAVLARGSALLAGIRRRARRACSAACPAGGPSGP